MNIKYFAWLSSTASKRSSKNPNIIFSGLVRDVPENLKYLLDKTEDRAYIEIMSE